MGNDNRNDGTAENIVQATNHEGDVNAPVINGDGATIVNGDNHGGIHQNFSKG
ncbi:hypothetical protein [Saccharopolyspora sp. NPDC002376]